MEKRNWRDEIKNIKIPEYLEEELEEYFEYVRKKDKIMYLVQIDNVLTNINVAEQEGDLSFEEARYIRKNIVGVH